MAGIVSEGGVTPLEGAILLLFVATFGWITVAFWSAVLGFVLQALGRHPLTLARSRHPADDGAESLPDLPAGARTALVMPAFNEDPARITEGLATLARSLAATGRAGHFDLHLLSDTGDPERGGAEETAWRSFVSAVRPLLPPETELSYRRRDRNAGRKAGNVAEFLRRRGGDYDFMVVLDADSVMSGPTLVRLVRAMVDNPRAGLIQTLPLPTPQRTPFGRLVRFAARLYGPMLATGQSFWQGDAANYWGHNAIVRVAPFARHCVLPVLPGRAPWGGEILSHDFVEAALLRRSGWQVFLLPELQGSLEDLPGSIPAFARRDRRWAQGSLQHLRLLGLPGLHPVSRLHLFLGAMGYLSSFLWLLLLLASTAWVALAGGSGEGGGAAGGIVPSGIVPSGIVSGGAVPGGAVPGGVAATGIAADAPLRATAEALGAPELALPTLPFSLLAVTGILLFLPRVLGLGLALARRGSRKAFGGGPRLLGGALAEMAWGVAVAPILMMFHARAVLEILAGRTVGWDPAHRDAATGGGLRGAFRSTGWITATGVVWSGVTLLLSPFFFLWMTPIFAGLLLAAPLTAWSGRAAGARDAA